MIFCVFLWQEKEKKEDDSNEFVSAVAWRPVSILGLKGTRAQENSVGGKYFVKIYITQCVLNKNLYVLNNSVAKKKILFNKWMINLRV